MGTKLSSGDLELAVKDPSNLSAIELDSLMETQLRVVQGIKSLIEPADALIVNAKKTNIQGARKRSLQNLRNRI